MSDDDPIQVVLVTFPDRVQATQVGRTLVEESLAACVNLTEVQSIYRWEARVTEDTEVLCVIKTTAARLQALRQRVVALHSYAVPEVIALQVVAGHAPYLAWVRASVSGEH